MNKFKGFAYIEFYDGSRAEARQFHASPVQGTVGFRKRNDIVEPKKVKAVLHPHA